MCSKTCTASGLSVVPEPVSEQSVDPDLKAPGRRNFLYECGRFPEPLSWSHSTLVSLDSPEEPSVSVVSGSDRLPSERSFDPIETTVHEGSHMQAEGGAGEAGEETRTSVQRGMLLPGVERQNSPFNEVHGHNHSTFL